MLRLLGSIVMLLLVQAETATKPAASKPELFPQVSHRVTHDPCKAFLLQHPRSTISPKCFSHLPFPAQLYYLILPYSSAADPHPISPSGVRHNQILPCNITPPAHPHAVTSHPQPSAFSSLFLIRSCLAAVGPLCRALVRKAVGAADRLIRLHAPMTCRRPVTRRHPLRLRRDAFASFLGRPPSAKDCETIRQESMRIR